MAISYSIDNIIGGINQEPHTQRNHNESEDQYNVLNSIDDGLIRKPGAFLMNHVTDLTSIKAFHEIEEKDISLIYDQNQDLRVFDNRESGCLERTVTFDTAQIETDFKAYMGTDPNAGFLSINDYTFIYNKDKTVTVGAPQNPDSIIKLEDLIVRKFDAAKTYGFKYSKVSSPTNYRADYFNYNESRIKLKEDLGGSYNSIDYSRKDSAQMARYLSSFSRSVSTSLQAFDGLFFSPQPLEIISSSTLGQFTFPVGDPVDIANTVTVTGYLYDEANDTFFEHTAIVTYPIGTSSLVIPTQNIGGVDYDKWGSIFKIELASSNVNFDFFAHGSITDYSDEAQTIPAAVDFSYTINVTAGNTITELNTRKFPNGNIITVETKTGETISDLYVTDGNEDYLISEVLPETRDIVDLPAAYYNNSIVKVINDNTNINDDYYVKFRTASGEDFGNGVWEESGDPLSDTYDNETMPFTVIFDASNNAVVHDGGWKSRLVGDSNTNKEPSFVDNTINEMFVFESRLGILTDGDKVSLSGSGDLFNFYRTTIVATLPSDRIDVTVTSDKLINLQYAIPFNKAMMLIDNKVQYIMSYQGGLSIDTLSIQEVGSYNTDLNVKPLQTNNSLFFISNYSKNSQLIKFFSKDIALVDGRNVTETVEKLLPNSISNVGVTSSNDLIALNKPGDDTIYVYNYRLFDQKNEFDAWTKITYAGLRIRKIAIVKEVLYIYGDYATEAGTFIYTVDLSKDTTIEIVDRTTSFDGFRLGMDMKEVDSDPYGATPTTSQYIDIQTTIPFGEVDTNDIRVISAPTSTTNTFAFGYSFPISNVTNVGGFAKVTIENLYYNKVADPDYLIERVVTGVVFESCYEFSKFTLKDRNGRPLNSGTTQLLALILTFAQTGGFKVVTDIINSGSFDELFTGRITGSPSAVLGEVNLESGSYNFYLGADKEDIKIKIKNLDYLPMEIQHAEYELEYDARAGRR